MNEAKHPYSATDSPSDTPRKYDDIIDNLRIVGI